jgi:hypothetical protein
LRITTSPFTQKPHDLSLRALELLDRFMSMGAWAVHKALSVGIFPYVFKLLSSPALVGFRLVELFESSSKQELRFILTSIWYKILAIDTLVCFTGRTGHGSRLQCREDLLKSPSPGAPQRRADGTLISDAVCGLDLDIRACV